MTHYDKAIDGIVDKIYKYLQHYETHAWNETDAKKAAHDILMTVEEFQTSRSLPRWRASD